MAGDTEDLVITVSADTKQIDRAINRLLGTVNSSTRDMEKAFVRSGDAMDRAGSSATRLQRQIESLAGVSGGMKDRSGDIAAYGEQLDAVRAKFNPLFAAQQSYRKSLDEINQAAKVGAISEKERVAALANTKSAFAAQVTGLKGVKDAGGLARYEMINLSRQIQDVGVSLVSGQSPFTVLVQQGTQIADIFGSSGTATVGGAIKQIGSGIASVITPMRLLGVAIVATAAGAGVAYSSWKAFTLQLDDTARSVGTTTSSLSKLQAAASFKGIAVDDFTKGMESFGKGVYDAKNNMGQLAEVFRVNNTHATSFDDALGKAADLIKRASTDQQRLVLLQQMGLPATMQWVRLLSGGAEGLNEAKKAAADFAANDDLIKSAREFDESWNKAWTNFSLNARSAFQRALDGGSTFFDKMDGLAKKAGNSDFWKGLYDDKSAAAAGVSLTNNFNGRFSGDSANSVSKSGALADALNKRAAALSGGPSAVDPNVLKDQIAKQQQYLGLLGQTMTTEEARRQVELQFQAAAVNGVKIDERRAEIIKRLAVENLLGITAMRQQADSYRIEAATIGMSVGQAAAYTAQQNALNDARRNGRALSAENIKNINDEAAALGRAAQAAANAQIARQIRLGGQTAFLSQDDVNIAQTLAAKYGDNVKGALESVDATALRLTGSFRQLSSSIENDLTSSLVDITTGAKSAKDGFADMAKAIIRDIEQMIIKLTIVGPLMRGIQSGLGFLMPGGAGGGGAGISLSSLSTLYDDGGYTGAGGKHQAAGIVHKGEYVMDAASTKRLGVPFLNALRGYADGGPVGLPNVGGAAGVAGGGVNLTVINQSSGAEVGKAQRKPDGSFEITIRDMVRGVINSDLSSGTGVARSFKAYQAGGSFRGA